MWNVENKNAQNKSADLHDKRYQAQGIIYQSRSKLNTLNFLN